MLPHKSTFADYMENLRDHGPRPSGMLPLTNVPYFLNKKLNKWLTQLDQNYNDDKVQFSTKSSKQGPVACSEMEI